MKRSIIVPARRRPWRAWSRSEEDKVTPELKAAVIGRDRSCIGYRLDPLHRCFTRFGETHAPTEAKFLEPDHVWWEPGGVKGKRAPSTIEHLVAMCGWLNNRPPSAEVREAERALLFKLYPEHGEWHGPCRHTT